MTSQDYSTYLRDKKVGVSQTGFSNITSTKLRITPRYSNYFPLYKSVGLGTIYNSSVQPTPPIFSPSDIAGLNLWMDAADSSTVTSVGGIVSQWTDKSINQYNLTQTDNTYRPSYSNNTIAFSSDRNFDIPISAINNAASYDIFIVFNPKASINWIFGKQYDGNYTGPVLSMTNYFQSGLTTGSTDYVYLRADTAGVSPIISSNSPLTLNTLQILGVHNNNTSDTNLIYSNGTELATTSASPIANTTIVSSFKLGAMLVHSTYTNSGSTNFNLCEMLFFNSGVSVSDRKKIEGYLAWKWGLEASLPSDHPYKNLKP